MDLMQGSIRVMHGRHPTAPCQYQQRTYGALQSYWRDNTQGGGAEGGPPCPTSAKNDPLTVTGMFDTSLKGGLLQVYTGWDTAAQPPPRQPSCRSRG